MISVVIPVYKNKEQFLSNLKHNLQFLKDEEVIIVNDDPSESIKDDLADLPVVLLENEHNMGFGKTVNKGVKTAKNAYVMLLNTDVKLLDNSYNNALNAFKNDDSLFAVSFAQKEKNEKIIGKNSLYWKRGFFYHKAEDSSTSGINGWAEGGSCIVDKHKFDELKGFDPLFTPFYWEDTDLSYRAWKKGWNIFFDSTIIVEHHHEGTINKYFKLYKKNAISARNHFIFIWKNITQKKLLIEHMLLLPYNLLYFVSKGSLFFVHGFGMALLLLPKILMERDPKAKKKDQEVISQFTSPEKSTH